VAFIESMSDFPGEFFAFVFPTKKQKTMAKWLLYDGEKPSHKLQLLQGNYVHGQAFV
jgi:hypothetical protein